MIDKREVGKIMQKLGQKGTTEEGLMDLYQYMQKHPNLKLDQIMNLSVASTTFRKYLEDGLKKAAYKDRLAKGGVQARLRPAPLASCEVYASDQYEPTIELLCCIITGIMKARADWHRACNESAQVVVSAEHFRAGMMMTMM